jgi:hypothetical protein
VQFKKKIFFYPNTAGIGAGGATHCSSIKRDIFARMGRSADVLFGKI